MPPVICAKILKEISKSHLILHKINQRLEEMDSNKSILPVAVFHTAVIAIIVTTVSSIIIFHVEKYNQMVNEAIRIAETINQIRFVDSHFIPKKDRVDKYNTKDGIKDEYIREISIYLDSGTNGGQKLPDGFFSYSVQVPEDPATRAENAMKLLNVILHRYPFPKSLFTRKEFQLVDSNSIGRKTLFLSSDLAIGPAEPFIFSNYEEIDKWLKDLTELCSRLSTLCSEGSTYPEMNIFLRKLLAKNRDIIKTNNKPILDSVASQNDPVFIFNDFLIKYEEVIALIKLLSQCH